MKEIEYLLSPFEKGVISFVGAGGKTSLMFQLAKILSDSGKKVLTTTTTKIFFPTEEQSRFVFTSDIPELLFPAAKELMKSCNHITITKPLLRDSFKLSGISRDSVHFFKESGIFDWILVEADGAAGLSLKAPADHEPVIPGKSNIVFGVLGLDVLGKSFSESTVFRSSLASKIMSLDEGKTISEDHICNLLIHPEGTFKGAPQDARKYAYLNKGDSPAQRDKGKKIAECIKKTGAKNINTLIVAETSEGLQLHEIVHFQQTA